MFTDLLDTVKTYIDLNSCGGDLHGIFLPCLRVYFAMNGCTDVLGVDYNIWDDHYEFAYVSFTCDEEITVVHHEGTYRVFNGHAYAGTVTNWNYDVGKKGCILESEYGNGIYDFLGKIDKWINYKCIRRQFGFRNDNRSDNFDCVFKGFVALCESLEKEAESCR